jgi:KDO2-lipid IV(A) lauroyltransferase
MGKRAMAREGGGERAPTLRHRAEYALVRLLMLVLLSTDVRGAARIGAFLGRALGALDRRHRLVAEDNLRRAYGGSLPEAEAARIARRVFERLGVTAAEIVHGPRRMRGRARGKWFRLEGMEELRRGAGDRPVVFLSAHFGNWEHLIPAAAEAGWIVVPVARPLDNPLLDRLIASTREAVGTFAVRKAGALRDLLRTMKAGTSIGMLVDQNAGRHGRLATFFGRPCSTQSAGVSLARRLGVPFSVGTLHRVSPGIHRLVMRPPVYVRDDDAAEREAVEEMNRQIEQAIRSRPEDWMWLHRRWRIKADWGFPIAATEDGAR